MVEAIKQSPESRQVKDAAKKKVVGIIGDLNQRRRRAKEMQERKVVQAPQPLNSVGENGTNGAHPLEGRLYANGVETGKENGVAGPYPLLPPAQ